MVRSLAAAIVGALIGLTAAKFIEGAGAALIRGETGAAFDQLQNTTAYAFVLLSAWSIGSFCAAASALLIGKKWAPLGWLGAASIFLSASMTVLTALLNWLLLPACAVSCAIAGAAAIRLVGARTVLPGKGSKESLFGD